LHALVHKGLDTKASAGGVAYEFSRRTAGIALATSAAFELAADRSENYMAASVCLVGGSSGGSGGGGGSGGRASVPLTTISVFEGVNGMILELFKAIDADFDGTLTVRLITVYDSSLCMTHHYV